MIETLANVKASMLISGSGDDALLTWLMAAADGYVSELTGRNFDGGAFTEAHPAGRAVLFLRNFPVASVTSVKVDAARAFGSDTVRAASTYVLHADRGVIESLTGPFLSPRGRDDWPAAVQVVYATATGAVPGAVKEAFAQLVGHWYRQAKTFSGQEYQMLMERADGTDAKAWPWSVTGGLKMPPGVRELLDPYRVPAV